MEPKLAKPNLVKDKMAINPKDLIDLCDEKTIGIVGILGNHYNGIYDPVWEIDKLVSKLNAEKGWQIGIHVDAASGGFIAPFQEEMADKVSRIVIVHMICFTSSLTNTLYPTQYTSLLTSVFQMF